MASTRNYFPDKDEFLDVIDDTSHALHYFTLYFKGSSWVCVPRQDLEEALQSATHRENAVVYAEGFGKTFPGNVDRATRFARAYNVTTILFDWSTYNPAYHRLRNFHKVNRSSVSAARCFAAFISDLDKFRHRHAPEFAHVSMILHSMGNLLMMHAIKNNYITVKDTVLDDLVLNAACVPQRHHKQWVEKINIQKHLYITRNNHDKTLNGAKLISFHRQLGERSRGPYAGNAVYINFSNELELEHNYFLYTGVLKQHPEVKKIYEAIFAGKEPVFSDKAKFHVNQNLVEMQQTWLPQKGDVGFSISP